MYRYMVQVEPTRPEATAALVVPVPTASGSRASFWGGANVHGQPGTVPVPSPRPAALTDTSWGGRVQPSGNAPDYIMPSQYQSVPSNQWAHVRYASSNEMPVPATPVAALPGVAMRSRRMGGQSQVVQPQAVQVWPDLAATGPDAMGGAGWKAGG